MVAFSMRLHRLPPLVFVAIAIVGCGGSSASSPATTTAAQTNLDLLKAYDNAVSPKLNAFGDAMTQAGSTCSTGTSAQCATAMQAALDAARATQQALKGHPAPACFGAAGPDMVAAVDMNIAALSNDIRAVITSNPDLVTSANTALNAASAKQKQANSEITQSTC
jgi:hypothetical protein